MRILLFLAGYAKRHVAALGLTILSMLLLVGAELLAPWLVRNMIALVKTGVADVQSLRRIGVLALLALAVYLARTGLQFVRSYAAHIAGWGVVASVRTRIYEHLQRLSLGFYDDKQTGQLMSRMVNDSDMFEKLIAHAVPDLAVNVLTLLGVGAVLLTINPRLMVISMIPIPFIFLAMGGFAKHVRPAFVERQKELGALNATLNDNLSGMREIQAFTREKSEAQRIGVRIDAYRNSLLKALRLMATFHPLVAFSSALGTVLLIYFGGRMALLQTLLIEDLVAFFLYLGLFYQPVLVLGNSWESIQEALAGADRVTELLAEDPEIVERRGAIDLQTRIEGAIEYKQVSFAYDANAPVLEAIDLSIPSRTSVALVGPTGVGKTMLVSLLPRFYDVSAGAVMIDGISVQDLTLESLRRQISIVSQDVFLFHGSVRENILFGREGAGDEEMRNAAQIANAADFIAELSDGYNTFIGERGAKLSGGQKQRIAIARAILKDAPILILDEATSSVDTETELLIQQALEHLLKDRTAIIIAHRLSTVRNADTIVVLQGSGIVEKGTHRELMHQDGLYRRLNDVQMRLDPRFDFSEWELDQNTGYSLSK